jgi:hypothetical protein
LLLTIFFDHQAFELIKGELVAVASFNVYDFEDKPKQIGTVSDDSQLHHALSVQNTIQHIQEHVAFRVIIALGRARVESIR